MSSPRIVASLALLCVLPAATAWAASARVALVQDAAWSPADASREGAAEMKILLELASLQQASPAVGIVGVGDRLGRFQEGTRRGLDFAARHGVPVVRLGRGLAARTEPDADGFINGGGLTPEAAQDLLRECLEKFGPLPIDDVAARWRTLRAYQAAFAARATTVVAVR